MNKVNSFKNIISVGDGLWDLETASNIGIHFVGIGHKNRQVFKNKSIKYHINDWTSFSVEEMERKLNLN